MITIKAPIELKVRSDLAKGYDAFGERIAGNYSLMGLEIGEEELLHMVSAPPEIYLMDEGSTTIGGNTFISSRNEEKYSIVNNMLNRIMLSVNGELTYQDRTYITDTLHKLGIKDDRKFMTEVREMISESHLEERFLNNYFEISLGNEKRELREKTLELSKELAKKDTYHTERSSEDFLSERILQRLRTGAIYQIVSNFNRSLNDTRIELQESMLSEQENVARKLLVQRFLFNVVKEEPELFREESRRAGREYGSEQTVREVSGGYPDRPGERVIEKREDLFRQSERELRESEQLRIERETALLTEHETAEIIYREGETARGEEKAAPLTIEERVITERINEPEAPGISEHREAYEVRPEQEETVSALRRTEDISAASKRERALSDGKPGERISERVTEETSHITERYGTDNISERAEQTLTEREEIIRSEHEQADIILREEENREAFEETILDRLTEKTALERESLTERNDAEYHSTERTETVPGQEIRTDRITSAAISREERERKTPNEESSDSITEYVAHDRESIIERKDSSEHIEHRDRYVTEQGEFLHTEHEGAEIVYREEAAPGETEEGVLQSEEIVRPTPVTERELIHETGDRVISEQRQPGAPGERVTEVQSRERQQESAEYHTTDHRMTERETALHTERKRIEQLLAAGAANPVQEAELRERLKELLTTESSVERERLENSERLTHRESYVTETGEFLHTEHEGAEIVYREEAAHGETEEGVLQSGEIVRPTPVTERELIHETGDRVISEQKQPGAPGERVTEVQSRERQQERAEYHTADRRMTERENALHTERERIEQLLAAGAANPVQEAELRERLKELLTTESSVERERLENSERLTHRESYVTETEEILRTEHEGAEIVYREEAAPRETEEGILQSEEIVRATPVTESKLIHETDERVISEQKQPGAPGERVTEVQSRERQQERAEYHTTDRRMTERENALHTERERIEQLLEAGATNPVQEAELRERLKELLTTESSVERERLESSESRTHRESYVTETGEILRTEHEGAEIVYREDTAASAGTEEGKTQTPEILRESTETEIERMREAGERIISEQKLAGIPIERVTEILNRENRLERTEYHTADRRMTDRETALRRERERIERILEAGNEKPDQEALLRERLTEIITAERSIERMRSESTSETERTERYVTEAGEIRRTEHEGAELIYREEGTDIPEGVEKELPGGIRETRESERERISEQERFEKEKISSITREETFSDIRSELREQLERERIRTEQIRAEQVNRGRAGSEQAELVYREDTESEGTAAPAGQDTLHIRESLEKERERLSERDRLERERSIYSTEASESEIRSELREQLREQLRSEKTAAGGAPEAGRTYERSELIYRETQAAGEEAPAEEVTRVTREADHYRSDNIYERELLERESSKEKITEGLTGAVLLDVVKTLFHAGYDKIGKGNTWIEYRGALYHSAENVFNRLNYNLDQRTEAQFSSYSDVSPDFSMDYTSIRELQEITENAGDVQTIENTIREMNEMNLQNVERYEQMVNVLKTLQPEKRRRTGGMQKTRQEALSLLDDEQALYESLKRNEDFEEDERREVFHEITRIFPEHSVEIFKVVEQYLDGAGQAKGLDVSRNNVEAAAEEIRRITAIPQIVQEPVPEPVQTESSELIFRRSDRMTQEELQEMMESIRRSENLQRREIDHRNQQVETDRRNTTVFTTNTERTLTRQDAEDIEALVSRGVRSQMSAISEQVLQKLEKKLKNEKIRRGI